MAADLVAIFSAIAGYNSRATSKESLNKSSELWSDSQLDDKTGRAMGQISFADAEYAGKRKKTRREVFLEEMEQVVPWKRCSG